MWKSLPLNLSIVSLLYDYIKAPSVWSWDISGCTNRVCLSNRLYWFSGQTFGQDDDILTTEYLSD